MRPDIEQILGIYELFTECPESRYFRGITRLEEYQRQPEHNSDLVYRLTGITPARQEKLFERLVKLGNLTKIGRKYGPTDIPLHITDERFHQKIGKNDIELASRIFSVPLSSLKRSCYRTIGIAVSEAQWLRMKNAYNRFLHTVDAILGDTETDQTPATRLINLCVLLTDMEELRFR